MKILPIALSAALVLPAFSGVVSANQTAHVSVASNVDKAVRTNELNILGYYDMKVLGIKVDYANKKLVTTYVSNQWAHPKYDSTYYTVKVTGLDGTVKANVSVNGKETSTKAGNVLNNLAIAEGDLISIVHVEAGTRFRVAGNIENLPAGQALTRTSNFYVVGDTLEYSNENKAELQGKLKTTLETASTYKADKYNTKGFAALQASIAKGNSTLKSGTNKALKEVTAEIN